MNILHAAQQRALSVAGGIIGWGLLFMAGTSMADILYVSPEGDNSDGSRWEKAFHHPADAIAAAAPDDTLYLAGRTFTLTPPVTINIDRLTVRGGFAATNTDGLPGENDPQRWPTVWTRNPSVTNRLLNITAHSTTVERIEFHGGYINGGWGGGLFATNVHRLILRDCRFRYNIANRSGGVGYFGRGGGVYLGQVSNALITRCQFHANESQGTTAGSRGGNLAVEGGSLAMFDVILTAGTTRGSGGAYPTGYGAGLWINGGTHALTNLLVAHHWIDESGVNRGGGMQIESGSRVTLANCTVYANYPEGIRNLAGTNTLIRNSIVYGNTQNGTGGARDIINGTDGTGTPPTLSHNLIGDGSGAGTEGNQTGDPLFEYPLMYLSAASPALDAGDGSAADAGLAGMTTRTNGLLDTDTVDLGYHDSEGLGVDLTFFVSPDGDDAHDGSAPEPAAAVRSITRALALAAADPRHSPRVRIHVAAGRYAEEYGESFPLSVSNRTIQIIGTNASATRIDAGGAAAGNHRVFTLLDSWGDNRIEGVTLCGGYYT